jgi:glycosyltransferase involved in cell wall biosynthesis
MTTPADIHDQPLVSFIVTYYNLPVDLLCSCIDSILALSLQPDEREIIIIDDGSNTSPMNSLMKYGDDIIYVRQKNGGLGSARNKGIEVATGEYLQFVDADDQLIKLGYDDCLHIIRHHQDADMVLFDFEDHHSEPANSPSGKVLPTSGTSYMRHNNIHGMACGYIFRQKTLSDLRFTQGTYHEDEEFTPQLLIRAEVVYPTKVKAYYYHRRSASITTNQDDKHIAKRLEDILQVIKNLHYIADRLSNNEQLAMERRVAQLTMDYLYNTIVLTRSAEQLDGKIEYLKQQGLYPLPDRNYTHKYQWFRRMINNRWGRMLLLKTLPLLKKER